MPRPSESDSETERLRAIQEQRAEREGELADEAADPNEQHTHERRADKADYLRQKLEEQEES